MDKRNIISYYTYRRFANKHGVKNKTITGKPVTYNKLKHRVDHFENEKHCDINNNDTITEHNLHNHIIKYMNCEIDDNELNTVMHNYIGV